MAKKTQSYVGPYRGEDSFRSPKTIDAAYFASVLNMIGRAGRLAIRPGHVLAQDASYTTTPFIVLVKAVAFVPEKALQLWPAGGKVFYSHDNSLRRCNYDGSSDEEVFNVGFAAVGWFALDIPNQDVYYVEIPLIGARKIVKYDSFASGGASSDIVTGEASDINGLAYTANQVYFGIGGGAGTIRRADTSGLNVNKTTLGAAGAQVVDLGILDAPSRLYITTPSNRQVVYMDLGGGATTTIFTAPIAVSVIAIAIDNANNKIYVSYTNSASINRILRMNNNGSNQEILYDNTIGAFGDLAFDPAAGRLFWFTIDANYPTLFSAFTDLSMVDVIDAITLKRAHTAVAANELTNDIIFFHTLDKVVKKGIYALYLPTKNLAFALPMGYMPAQGVLPMTLVMPSRIANPAPGIHYVQNSRRSTFLWHGATFTSGRGGLGITHGGVSWFNIFAPYTFNEIRKVDIGSPTSGSFTLTFDGQTTAPMTWNYNAANVKSKLEALSSIGVGNVQVTGGNRGPYIITFVGTFAGTNVTPALTGDISLLVGGSLTISTIREGGSVSQGLALLLQEGIPRPGDSGEGGPSSGGPTIAPGNLQGVYSYRTTFYSSLLHKEGPPSTETGKVLPNAQIPSLVWAVPNTLLFSTSIPGGPIVDKMRIYRRKWSSFPSLPPDGVDATDNWYFVGEVDVHALRFHDNASEATDDRVPTQKEYPPANAAFGAVVRDRAVYLSDTPGDRNAWVSETPIVGGIGNEELGFGYVRNNAFTTLAPWLPTDATFTGLISFLDQVLLSSEDHVILGQVPHSSEENIFVIRPLLHISGFASHWLATRSEGVKNGRRIAIWMNKNGWVYTFDGMNEQLISRAIDPISRSLVRLSWRRDDFTIPHLNSLYYATIAWDSINNRMLLIVPQQIPASNYPTLMLALDLDTEGSWYKWDIPARFLFQGREWDAADGTLVEDRVLLTIAGRFHKLLEGRNDAGVNFNWYAHFRREDFGDMAIEKKMTNLRLDLETRSFGGAAASVDVRVVADTTNYDKTLQTPFPDDDMIVFGETVRGKRLQLRLSGTQQDNQSHAELVGASYQVEPVSKPGEAS